MFTASDVKTGTTLRRAYALRGLMALAAVGLGTLCPGAAAEHATAQAHAAVPYGIGVAPPGHLYVGEASSGHVYRFTLIRGIPARTPSSVLNVPHVLIAFAVGSDGSLYLSRYDQTFRYFVDVYAPGASGNQPPVRTVAVTNVDIFALWVDPLGYLYADGWRYGIGGRVDIYPPGASQPDPPVQIISLPLPNDFAGAMVTDPQGNLYVSSSAQSNAIYVYQNPISHPTLIRQFCAHVDAYFIALNTTGDIYIAPNQYRPGANISIPVLAVGDKSCPSSPIRRIYIPGASIETVGGLAIWGNFLYAAMRPTNPRQFNIYTLDARRNAQQPLSMINMKNLGQYGFFIALGP
jgi:hypothetical protein